MVFIMTRYHLNRQLPRPTPRGDKAVALMRMFALTSDRLREGNFELDCSLDIEPGDVVYVTGPSGSGKTTILRELERRVPAEQRVNLADIELPDDRACVDCFVIIDPRFRGLGLAGRLVRETMPLLDVPIIEARAVMGRFHPFFERAGMQAWDGPAPQRCTRLAAAFESAGITQRDLIDAQRTQGLLDALDEPRRSAMEREIAAFIKCYGKRRNMPPGLQRTRFVLTRLMGPPAYYIWFNPRYGDPRRTTQDSRRTIDDSQPTTRKVGCRPFTRRKAVPRASGPQTRVSRPRNVAWACSPCTVGRIPPLPVSPRPLPSAKAAPPVAVPPAGCPPAPSSIVPHPSSVVERIPIVSRETAARFIAAHVEARCHKLTTHAHRQGVPRRSSGLHARIFWCSPKKGRQCPAHPFASCRVRPAGLQ